MNASHAARRILRVVLLVIVVSSATLMLLENRLLYYPDKQELHGADAGLTVRYFDFASTDGVKLHGAYVPAPNARGAILWCHGNGGNLSYGFDVARKFQKLGVSTFLFDYRGYGKSDGSPGGDGILRAFWMGQKLFETAPEPKEFLELATEGHNDTFGARQYFPRVQAFLDRVLPAP